MSKVAMRPMGLRFPTCIQQINYPVHEGKPNPVHGWFFLVGSVPGELLKDGKSMKWATLEEAEKAIVAVGVTQWQRPDCSWAGEL